MALLLLPVVSSSVRWTGVDRSDENSLVIDDDFNVFRVAEAPNPLGLIINVLL